MTQPDKSITEVDTLVADVRARVLANGMIWAEGWGSSALLSKGSRLRVRLSRPGSMQPGELIELELDLVPDAEEVKRLRARIAELEAE